jgi:hypothetical protein
MSSADDDETFNKLLDEYKSNYVQFVTLGNTEYKTAYTNARNAIQSMISEKRGEVDKERQDMKHFVGAYKEDGDALGEMQDRAGKMYKNAQKIQDNYETSKQRYDNWVKTEDPSPVIDYTNGYGILWRIGSIALCIIMLFWVGYYNPSIATQPWSTAAPSFALTPFLRSAPGTPASPYSIYSP